MDTGVILVIGFQLSVVAVKFRVSGFDPMKYSNKYRNRISSQLIRNRINGINGVKVSDY